MADSKPFVIAVPSWVFVVGRIFRGVFGVLLFLSVAVIVVAMATGKGERLSWDSWWLILTFLFLLLGVSLAAFPGMTRALGKFPAPWGLGRMTIFRGAAGLSLLSMAGIFTAVVIMQHRVKSGGVSFERNSILWMVALLGLWGFSLLAGLQGLLRRVTGGNGALWFGFPISIFVLTSHGWWPRAFSEVQSFWMSAVVLLFFAGLVPRLRRFLFQKKWVGFAVTVSLAVTLLAVGGWPWLRAQIPDTWPEKNADALKNRRALAYIRGRPDRALPRGMAGAYIWAAKSNAGNQVELLVADGGNRFYKVADFTYDAGTGDGLEAKWQNLPAAPPVSTTWFKRFRGAPDRGYVFQIRMGVKGSPAVNVAEYKWLGKGVSLEKKWVDLPVAPVRGHLATFYAPWFEAPFEMMFRDRSPGPGTPRQRLGLYVCGLGGLVHYGSLLGCAAMYTGLSNLEWGDLAAFDKMAGMPVATGEPGFTHYNPLAVRWAQVNLVPDPGEAFLGATFADYYPIFERFVRLLADAHWWLRSHTGGRDEAGEYWEAAQGGKGLDFLNAQYGRILPQYEEKEAFSPFTPAIAVGFWLRRQKDGSAEALDELLMHVLRLYDRPWLEYRQKSGDVPSEGPR